MLSRTLSHPDPESERGKPNYSPGAASALIDVYDQRRDDAFPYAFKLEPFLGGLLSDYQRLRILYLVGCSAFAQGHFRQAIALLDEAADIANDLGDFAAFAEAAERLAFVHYVVSSFQSASGYYAAALDAMEMCSSPPYARALAPSANVHVFCLELLWGMSTQAFLTAEYEAAWECIHAARNVASRIPQPVRRVATVEWTAALLHRWQHQPLDAHKEARHASREYEHHLFGSQVERGRLHIVVVDTALDIVERFPEGTYHDEALKRAHRHVTDALAMTTTNAAGQGMALLAYARYLRLAHSPEDRFGIIERAYVIGLELDDSALRCQALAALGDEYMASGEREQGLNAYRAALSALSTSDAVVIGAHAREELLRANDHRAS